jgi:hypothetical protein
MLFLLFLHSASPQAPDASGPALLLEGKAAKLKIELGGGAISDFQLADLPLNPLTWHSEGESPRLIGHFVCLDRWGAPSEAEQRNGMPFHGEAPRVMWRTVTAPAVKGSDIQAEMTAVLPLAGLEVSRIVRLSQKLPLFRVTERVTNKNKLGRIYNMVQHPTIAPPFLDEQTLIDSNATRGFMQSSPLPNPEQPLVEWPQASDKGVQVDMRQLKTEPSPNVVSYVIQEEYGWTTASSVSRGLLIGYLWKTSEYPWFNAWRHVEKGRPAARGLEFGTTGLHQPFGVLVKKGRIFDRPLYAHLDTGQAETRSYVCFLFKIPTNYKGVAKVIYDNGRLQLLEHGGDAARTLSMEVGNLF